MTSIKRQLKTARDALSNKDYHSASEAARQVLEHEPDNYTAHVFLGLSNLELGHYEACEQAYLQAISLKTDNPLAWQGITKFYESRELWEKCAESLNRLVELYSNMNEIIKCAESWQRLVVLHRDKGPPLQLIESLCLLLPGSKLHGKLSDLPAPDSASASLLLAQSAIHNSLSHVMEIVELVEEYEKGTIAKELEKRRTRLGAAAPSVLTKEVTRETLRSSKLPLLYNEILSHPDTSDDLRHSTQTKLLQHKSLLLHSTPDIPQFSQEKSIVLAEVEDMARGAVLLRIPDEFAWTLVLEEEDCETVADYDHDMLVQFIEIFPSSPTSSLLKGYLTHMNISLSEGTSTTASVEDPFDTILNAYAAIPDSVIANRVLTEVYTVNLDYERAIKAAENGLQALHNFESNSGRNLPNTRIGYKVALVTSFVHLSPPKHHIRAMKLINEVLSCSPDNVTCLMGRGYILEAENLWGDAAYLFSRVSQLLPENLDDGLRAKEEYAWCHCHLHEDVGISLLQDVLETLKHAKGSNHSIARCLWRIGTCYMDMKAQQEEAYECYISSLKADPTYAPAFTSLGVYYSEVSSPPDPRRASKCFQKAFELDSKETEAARRLAAGFADENAWDLVEVISRRVIDNEGFSGQPSDFESQILPDIYWAWKAISIVEFNLGNYLQSIQATQILLRFDPEDSSSWSQLGEAYIRSGQHSAAVKAFDRAYELDPGDWVCSYLIGDAKYQIGNFTAAIDIYKSILSRKPSELGVLISLCQAYLDQARREISESFFFRAEQTLVNCILTSSQAILSNPGFRAIAWKIMSDSIYTLSRISTYHDDAAVREALRAVCSLVPAEYGHPILGSTAPLEGPITDLKVLEVAISAYYYRTSLGSISGIKNGSSYYDLGNALHSWHVRAPHSAASNKIHAEVLLYLARALQEESELDLYWLALGNAYFLSDAQRAQHAYIRAIEIDSQNTIPWTSLGLLYLYHDDVQLAVEVLHRAQTLDPDYAVTWVGQAIAAMTAERDREATEKLGHALGLTPKIPEAELSYAAQLFNQYRHSSLNDRIVPDELLYAFSVLNHYCARLPNDAAGLHLSALVCEGLGHLHTAESLLKHVITILELDYEASEDPLVEHHFTTTNSNLGRIQLGLRNVPGAIQSFKNASVFLSDNGKPEVRTLILQTLLGLGVANFMQSQNDVALANFEAALQAPEIQAELRGHVGVLLAQAMWAARTDTSGEHAKAQLLECVSADPGNLIAIDALVVIGLLTSDESLVDAALSELLILSPERRKEMDPECHFNNLLITYHLGLQDLRKAKSTAQNALFSQPSELENRTMLAMLLINEGRTLPALALLFGLKSDIADVMSGLLCLQAVATRVFDDMRDAFRKAQQAVLLSPSNKRCWQTLALMQVQTNM